MSMVSMRVSARMAAVLAGVMVWITAHGSPAMGQVAPSAPVITEPATDGRILSAEDVHMESGPFVDGDPGDTHLCTDWEIWTTAAPVQRVWSALCAGTGGGIERVHIHLGDGVFENALVGRTSLNPGLPTGYRLRVRHRDSSGDAATEWSAYAERPFGTAAAVPIVAMSLEDAAAAPTPTLRTTASSTVELPGGATPGVVRLETATNLSILEFRGRDAAGNLITNASPLGLRAAARVELTAGGAAMVLPDTNLGFTDGDGNARVVYIPAMVVAPGTTRILWIAGNGSTFEGTTAQTSPSFTTLARGAAAPWTVRQPGFIVDTFSTGFQLPVNIAFIPSPGPAPDAPLLYVAELYGQIKVVRRNGAASNYASGLLNFNPTGAFPGSGEQGVTGICVEPVTGDVLATMLYDAAPPNGPHYPKVVRFHSTDGGLTAATQTIVLDMAGATQGASHQVSNISIGPDGKLYVHNGDGFDASVAQTTSDFRGKILRLNLDGSAPSDNPFYNGAPFTAADYVHASGLRNPFGGAWRASDGNHYTVENGPSIDRLSRLVAGRNYGWNGSDASMMTSAMHTWNPSTAPVNIAFIQPETFNGSGFPATLYGRGYISESGPTWATGPQTLGKRITEVIIDASGNFQSGPIPLIEYNGSGKATCSALAAGPDGLYFSDLYKDSNYTSPIDAGAGILRVRHAGFASFAVSPDEAPSAPALVQFTDTSTIPGGATGWGWDFGDGTMSTLRNPAHLYTAPGLYTVGLTVTGAAGSVATQRVAAVAVAQPPPIAYIAGTDPPAVGDQAVIDRLRAAGYRVTNLDDNRGSRPNPASLANQYGLVIVSSTADSGQVAGDFRAAPIPMIFWESALLSTTREALASAGTTAGGQGSITITATTHPVTRNLAAGQTTIFTSNQTLSVASGTIAPPPGALVLAIRNGTPAQPAIMVADTGAALLSGYTTPARRVFLPLHDTSFLVANANARTILDNSVCWAMGLIPAITTPPAPVSVPIGSTAIFTVVAAGGDSVLYQWRKGGVALGDGGRVSGALTPTLTITGVQAADAGSYDVVASNACGTATSAAAALTITLPCPADFNGVGGVTVQDIFDFLGAYFAGNPAADFNGVGGVTVQDIFDFLSAYFTGCP